MLKKKKKIVAPRVANKAGYQVQDIWFHRAKAAGYRARSAFKLLQIQEKTSLIRPDTIALDLGCAPGSWLQVLSQIVGENGRILGVDLQEVDKFSQKHITTLVGDMMAADTHEKIREYLAEIHQAKIGTHEAWWINDKGGFHLITSDVAPKTTGRTDDDQYHSAMLCLEVLKIAEKFLTPGGSLVMKIFVGRDLSQVLHKAKYMFKKIQTIKPAACRDRSFEEYVVCKGFNS
jgi:23S rRNA (uridine2552-2'-O)-methyltransferase